MPDVKKAGKRKAIGKKLRFEIFKRDGFSCAYCGNTPPAVVLEVDHITAVANGGENDPDNLITSCFDCNRGKGARELSSKIPSISERMKREAELEEQLKAYRQLKKAISRRMNRDVKRIESAFTTHFPDRVFTDSFRSSIKTNFIPHFDVDELEGFMHRACAKTGEPTPATKFFCGLCWKIIRDRSRG